MKLRLKIKDFTFSHYLHYIRRRSVHIQHMHAIVFAGTITILIAVAVLYADYGFWNEQYVRSSGDDIATSTVSTFESPSDSLGRFLGEAKVRLGSIGSGLLTATDTYTK